MRNTIRCCISCILPCGALDVIRIVHSDGRVEEIGGGSPVSAAEIMKAYPKHVLKKPSSRCPIDEFAPVPRIVVVPPDALLKRGRIYFLIPVSSPEKTPRAKKSPANTAPAATRRKRSSSSVASSSVQNNNNSNGSSRSSSNNNNDDDNEVSLKTMMKSERYLREIMREKVSTRERRRGRVGVWRPNLESISESSATTTGDQ